MNANGNPPDLPPGSLRLYGTVAQTIALAHQAHVTRVRLVAEARHTFGVAAARQL